MKTGERKLLGSIKFFVLIVPLISQCTKKPDQESNLQQNRSITYDIQQFSKDQRNNSDSDSNLNTDPTNVVKLDNSDPVFDFSYKKLPPLLRNQLTEYVTKGSSVAAELAGANFAFSPDGRRMFFIYLPDKASPLEGQIRSVPFIPSKIVKNLNGQLDWLSGFRDYVLPGLKPVVGKPGGRNSTRLFYSNHFAVGQSLYPKSRKIDENTVETIAEYKILGMTEWPFYCLNGTEIHHCKNGISARGSVSFATVRSTEICTISTGNCMWEDQFVDEEVTPITYTDNGAQVEIKMYEPTITADGRLLVFNGFVYPDGSVEKPGRSDFRLVGSLLLYSYNPEPFSSKGWSKPKLLSNLYNDRNVDLQGIKLGKRFPLAEKPITDSKGDVITLTSGTYPWISAEGSELFHTVTDISQRNSEGIVTSNSIGCQSRLVAFGTPVVVGKLTGHKVKLLDSPINPHKSGAAFANLAVSTNGTPDCQFVPHKIRFTTSLGMVPHSFWQSPFSKDKVKGFPFTAPLEVVPTTMKMPVYPIFDFENWRYSEISMHDTNPDNIFFLHMGEFLQWNTSSATPFPEWGDKYFRGVYDFDLSRTPDSSLNKNNGYLKGGAHFPYSVGRGDINVGHIGQGIELPNGGFIEITYHQTFDAIDSNFTVEGMINLNPNFLQAGSKLFNLFTHYDAWALQLTLDRKLKFVFYDDIKFLELETTEAQVPIDKWVHLAVVKKLDNIKIYLDGEEIHSTTNAKIAKMRKGVKKPFYIGFVNNAGSASGVSIATMDEVSLSSDAKTKEEIAFISGHPIEKIYSHKYLGELPPEIEPSVIHINPTNPMTKEKIELGRSIFSDRNLSADKKISCMSCHNPDTFFTDGKPVAVGVFGKVGVRNSPTIVNRIAGSTFMLDGSAESLEEQVLKPFFNKVEMGLEKNQLLSLIRDGYATKFKEIYKKDELNFKMVAEVLASFVNAQVHYKNPLSSQGLSDVQLHGREVFFGKGRCSSCHFGPNLTDERFHNTTTARMHNSNDYGRFNITQRKSDLFSFKTPTLYGISKTAPYFHDGRMQSLLEVVLFYNHAGKNDPNEESDLKSRSFDLIPLNLDGEEINALVEYLNSL